MLSYHDDEFINMWQARTVMYFSITAPVIWKQVPPHKRKCKHQHLSQPLTKLERRYLYFYWILFRSHNKRKWKIIRYSLLRLWSELRIETGAFLLFNTENLSKLKTRVKDWLLAQHAKMNLIKKFSPKLKIAKTMPLTEM